MGSAFVVTTASGFEGEARREILRLLPSSNVRKLFFKGNLHVECGLPKSLTECVCAIAYLRVLID